VLNKDEKLKAPVAAGDAEVVAPDATEPALLG